MAATESLAQRLRRARDLAGELIDVVIVPRALACPRCGKDRFTSFREAETPEFYARRCSACGCGFRIAVTTSSAILEALALAAGEATAPARPAARARVLAPSKPAAGRAAKVPASATTRRSRSTSILRPVAAHAATPAPKSRPTRQRATDDDVRATLQAAVAREDLPPWERHPVPWDNVAVRAPARRAAR